MSDEPATVLDALRVLAADGYDASFSLVEDGVRCSVCASAHPMERLRAARVYRFEGPSDPDEEAAVYALECPRCGAKGVLVSTYGPAADPALTDHLDVPQAHSRDR
ncbi:MAG TPA: phosphoribosylpyrophosphate synthetase [Acidimicrobiia bacterium]|nr:phosphoribosylpyrophosphate synthetase [Acidimicrobiia bacterium]